MKRILSVFIAAALLILSAISAQAAAPDLADTGKTVITIGDWVYEKINDGTQWELDEYVGEGVEVYVPRFYADSLVVSLGNHCFANNTNVTSVVTSSPLWTIGEYAFIDCTSLEAIELNSALHTIGIGAFSGTSALKDINLQNTIVTKIEPYTFLNSGIEYISLPETCTELTHDCFAQCYQLTRINIPSSVITIHDDAFRSSNNVVIYCYTDSAAHQFAVEKDIPFVLIDAPVEVTFIMGDADGDGYISVLDATKVQRVLADLDEDPDGMIALRAADGETLNIMHATAIQRYLADYDVKEPIGEEVTRTVTV